MPNATQAGTSLDEMCREARLSQLVQRVTASEAAADDDHVEVPLVAIHTVGAVDTILGGMADGAHVATAAAIREFVAGVVIFARTVQGADDRSEEQRYLSMYGERKHMIIQRHD